MEYIIMIEDEELKKCEVISRSYKKDSVSLLYEHYKREYPNAILKVYQELKKGE